MARRRLVNGTAMQALEVQPAFGSPEPGHLNSPIFKLFRFVFHRGYKPPGQQNPRPCCPGPIRGHHRSRATTSPSDWQPQLLGNLNLRNAWGERPGAQAAGCCQGRTAVMRASTRNSAATGSTARCFRARFMIRRQRAGEESGLSQGGYRSRGISRRRAA